MTGGCQFCSIVALAPHAISSTQHTQCMIQSAVVYMFNVVRAATFRLQWESKGGVAEAPMAQKGRVRAALLPRLSAPATGVVVDPAIIPLILLLVHAVRTARPDSAVLEEGLPHQIEAICEWESIP